MPRKTDAFCKRVEKLAHQQWALEKRAEEVKNLAKSLKKQVAKPIERVVEESA